MCFCLPTHMLNTHYQAIEDGEFSALKQAIQEMKKSADGSSALLDTCCLMEKSGVAYSMSLLALCGFHGRKDMVDLLLMEGAGNVDSLNLLKIYTLSNDKSSIKIQPTIISCEFFVLEKIRAICTEIY